MEKKDMALNLFISHKIREQGETVKSLANVLERFTKPSDLLIFYSKNIKSGENYRQRIIQELKNTDVFLLMCNYSDPPYINDWCSFEMGYFSSIADQDKKKLISLVKKNGVPPDPVKDLQCVEDTYEGIKKLLKEIFNNDHKPLRKDLFYEDKKDLLDSTIGEILKILEPVSQKTILTPRVWITIKKEQFEDFKKGKIPLPRDTSTITGETEVFIGQKLCFFDNYKLTTLEEFDKIVEYPPALDPFFTLLGKILQKIVNAPKKGPWRVPPVRIFNNFPPRIIVPASLEKSAGGDYSFEFFVTEPPPYTEKVPFSEYSALYNLFIIGWSFRWRVIESHLKELNRKKNTESIEKNDEKRKKKKLKDELEELYLDIKSITLESFNRRIENEADVLEMFSGEEKEIMKNILFPKIGLWDQIKPNFFNALDAEKESLDGKHVDDIIKYLKIWRDLNKTVLILTLRRLVELTNDQNKIKGNFVTNTTTIEDLLKNQ
jgi:hypothetical protein